MGLWLRRGTIEMNLKSDCPAVLFLIFNRPNLTQEVFDQIRRARPSQLFIAADGPRLNTLDDRERCIRARQIVEQVDWECQVRTLFRESNLGCKRAVSTAIDWFFEAVEEGIILEDDCVPSQSFFWFCQELLERFRSDSRIMMITGLNRLERWNDVKQDYHFAYGGIWGWATWRRAWQLYDVDISQWGEPEAMQALRDFVSNENIFAWLEDSLNRVARGAVDTWDYQWMFAMGINSGLSVVPSRNLISNIGFGPDATHTIRKYPETVSLPTYEMTFPLRHRKTVVVDREYFCLALHKTVARSPTLHERITKRLKGLARIAARFAQLTE